MSIHGQEKVAPHTHQEITVESRKRRPKYKGTHASDVVVDSTLTLDETVVEFTRKYEAEDATLTHGTDVTTETDSTASGGKCVKLLSTNASQDLVRKLGILNAGEWNLLFRLKVSNNASSSAICRIGAYHDGVDWVTYRDVKANEFPTANAWQYFAVRVNVSGDWAWSMRCYFNTGIANLECDYIGFLPAHIPLGYADVSTDAHTGTNTSAHSGTDTNPHSGTDTDAHAGTTAGEQGLSGTNLLSLGLGTEQNVTSTETTIRSGTCGSEANAGAFCKVRVQVVRGASGGSGHAKVRLVLGGVEVDARAFYWSTDLTAYQYDVMLGGNFSNSTCYLYGKKDGAGSIYIRGGITVTQYKKHAHTMTDPSDHTETDPVDHTETDPINHVITQLNNHQVTEAGHEH